MTLLIKQKKQDLIITFQDIKSATIEVDWTYSGERYISEDIFYNFHVTLSVEYLQQTRSYEFEIQRNSMEFGHPVDKHDHELLDNVAVVYKEKLTSQVLWFLQGNSVIVDLNNLFEDEDKQ